MAQTKKNTTPAPAKEAPKQEATTPEQEAHLDPTQFEDMDDANLHGLAQDLGLDPTGYENRDALIAAIAAVPVIPGPPEAEADPGAPEVQDPAPEQESSQGPQEAPAAPDPEEQPPEDPTPDPEPEPVPVGERPLPYRATVAVSVGVLHKAVGIGTADMLKPVGSLRQGAEVTVTGRSGPYAQIKNGLWIKEAFLEVQPLP